MKSTTSRFVKQSATSSTTSSTRQQAALSSEALIQSRQSEQEHQQQPSGSDQRLSSLVRNASDIGDSSYEQQQQQQASNQEQRRRLLAAEFADDSLRSQIGVGYGTPPSLHRQQHPRAAQSRSFSLSSLKQSDQRDPKRYQKEIDVSSLNDESQHLMTTTITTNNTKDCSSCRTQTDSNNNNNNDNNNPAGNCNCCACFARKRELRAKRTAVILEQMSTSAQTTKLIPAYFIAELIGTFLLVVIGDGAVAAYVLTKRQVDVFVVCFAFGVGAMIGTFASGKISGAHLNPAATLANALQGKLKWSLVPIYMVAQYMGAFLAALVLFLNYNEAINSFDGGQHEAFGTPNSTGGIFATYPAPYVTVWGSLMDQIVGTAILLFSISAVCDTKNRAMDERQQPLVVAFVIGLICVAFSPNCGAIFNPARDLSPRIITAIFGYPNVWDPIEGTYWVLTAVVGPHIGAIIGVFAYDYLIGSALRAFENHAEHLAELHDGHPEFACHIGEKPPLRQTQLTTIKNFPQQQPVTPPSIQSRLSDYGAAH